MALFSERGWDDMIAAYAQSHRHPVNRACHTAGIPLIALSLVTAVVAIAVPGLAGDHLSRSVGAGQLTLHV